MRPEQPSRETQPRNIYSPIVCKDVLNSKNGPRVALAPFCCLLLQAKVGAKEELDALLPEYEGNPKPGFRKGVQDLGQVCE